MGFRFPKAVRLHRSGEFRKVRENGRTASGRMFLLGALAGAGEGPARFGIVTGKRLGGAVLRVRARRRLREALRLERSAFHPGAWVVLVARRGCLEAPLPELRRELLRLGERTSILTRP
jgi:ribonuclease P protein component